METTTGRPFLRSRGDLARDQVAGEGGAARAVHPQHHGLHAGVGPEAPQFEGQAVAADLVGAATSVDDLAFGVDHRDLVGAAGQLDLVGVARQRHLAEGRLAVVDRRPRLEHFLDEFVALLQGVHQLERQGLLRGEDAAGVGRAVERGVGELTGLGDLAHDPAPHALHQPGGLLAGRLAHAVAEEGLHRRLVFADLSDLHPDPERPQRFAEIEVARGEALELEFAGGVHRDLVGDAREVVFALAAVLDPGEDRLAALLAELGDGLAELAQLDDAGVDLAGDHDAQDVPVLGGQLERGERPVEVHRRAGVVAEQRAQARFAVRGGVVHHESVADDE